MAKKYIFSDLAYVLGFFAETESIYIVPEGFFDFAVDEYTIEIKVTSKDPIWDATKCKAYREKVTQDKTFKKTRMNYGAYSCDLFYAEGQYFTTLQKFLAFLDDVGLIYRPDIGLPPFSDRGVRVGELIYFAEPVITRDKRTLHGFKLALYREHDLSLAKVALN